MSEISEFVILKELIIEMKTKIERHLDDEAKSALSLQGKLHELEKKYIKQNHKSDIAIIIAMCSIMFATGKHIIDVIIMLLSHIT